MRKLLYLSLFVFLFSFTTLILSPSKVSAASTEATGSFPATLDALRYEMLGCPETGNADRTSGELHTYTCPTYKDQITSRLNTPIGRVLILSGALYESKPASIEDYFEWEIAKIQKGPDVAFAQNPNEIDVYRPGLGFSLLQPVQGFWAWSRNIVYVLFIVLIIIIAFLILFRKSISGQTPITIFNSIPTIILALILITFSYPVSAIFVDITTVGINLVQNLMLSGPGAPGYSTIWQDSTGQPIQWRPSSHPEQQPEYISRYQLQPDDPQMSLWQLFNTANIQFCKEGDTECAGIETLIPKDIGSIQVIGGLINDIVNTIQNIGLAKTLLDIVLGFAAFTAATKIFFSLLNKYIVLTIGPILAPFYFFFAALPGGGSNTVINFIKINLGAALTFIVTYALFLFIIVFVKEPTTQNLNWIPPLMGYDASQYFAGNMIHYLIAYATFLLAPSISKFIDNFLNIPSANEMVQQLGQSINDAASNSIKHGKMLLGTFASNKIPEHLRQRFLS